MYARLGNFKVYIQWLPVLIGWSLIADPFGVSFSEALAVLLLMAAALCGTACGGALDHLQGYRDGIDQQTYGADDVLGGYQTKSDASIKPLVRGEITDPEARRFGIGIGVLSVILGTAAVLLAPDAPLWLIPVWGLWVLISSQYSYGIKISYWGPAELELGILIGGIVAIPVIMLEGGLSTEAAFVAVPDRHPLLAGHALLDDLRPRRRRVRGPAHARRPLLADRLPRDPRALDHAPAGRSPPSASAPARSTRGCWPPGCRSGRCRSASCATASSAPTR